MMDCKKNFATTLNSERGRFILNKVLNQDFKNSQFEKSKLHDINGYQ